MKSDTFDDIVDELENARRKFPGNAQTMMALVEEVGELAKALLEEKAGIVSHGDVYREAVQCAVMAIRVMEEGDEDYTYEPLWGRSG